MIREEDGCVWSYPDGDLATPPNVQAALRHTGVGIGLLLEILVGDRQRESHVELSVGDIDTLRGKALQDGCQGLGAGSHATAGARSAFRSQVSLETNTIDADAVRLDEIDDAAGTSSLVAVVLQVVVVVWRMSAARSRDEDGSETYSRACCSE